MFTNLQTKLDQYFETTGNPENENTRIRESVAFAYGFIDSIQGWPAGRVDQAYLAGHKAGKQ